LQHDVRVVVNEATTHFSRDDVEKGLPFRSKRTVKV
jgi:hypothetical protein